jgi:hypothetical protein
MTPRVIDLAVMATINLMQRPVHNHPPTDDPFPAVADIKDHVAFYADRVTVNATPGPDPRP